MEPEIEKALLDSSALDTDRVLTAARIAGLDPSTLAFLAKPAAAAEATATIVPKGFPLSDEEWALIGPLCPLEDRANSWSWREFLDVELWLMQPRNKLSFLSSANAHRCRKRAAAVRGDFHRLLEAVQSVAGLTERRKDHLLCILGECVKEAERFRAKLAASEAPTRNR
jgi:hypothetical protein